MIAYCFCVRGEGEYSFVNLIKELEKTNPDFNKVCGIAFKENGKVIKTPAQPLIKNLDDLPLPAYDLMPIHLYGKAKFIFDPGGITLHHSRGCIDSCKFCVWWVQMSEEKIKDGKVINIPRWRTKSVPKMMEEIKLLVYKYNRRGYVFVDDSWNISKQWNEEFAETVLRENIKINWFAFMRADFIVRDEKAGVLKKLVKAGLKHICIGVERGSNQELNIMNKPFYSTDIVKECFSILKNKYPEVFRQATFIVGIRDESKKTMLAQAKYAKEICADYPGFHPMTPVPGTEYWEEAKREGYLEITDFKFYDWCTPVISTKYLKRDEVEKLMYTLNKKFTTPLWLIKGLFSRYTYKRKMYIWWLLVFLRVFFRNLLQLVNPLDWDKITGLVKPKWYDK
ncbi:MAG: radical SAM protein [Cyanobacteria bacterium]|nr:radical SAM protein [Cyanobacteriota bacterium]